MVSTNQKKFTPFNSIGIIEANKYSVISPDQITPEKVGLKAYGLSSIPSIWTLPFFVVSNNNNNKITILNEVVEMHGFNKHQKLIVRSSGVDESINDRGSLESKVCSPDKILETISKLQEELLAKSTQSMIVHWIIQPYIPHKQIGHLSNERRLSKVSRDWVIEVEDGNGIAPNSHPLSLRDWRDKRPLEISELKCEFNINYIDSLKPVAVWAHKKNLRLHFEWVINDSRTYIVQADECDTFDNGVDPVKLVKEYNSDIDPFGLNCFSIVEDKDYNIYRKLANAKIYKELGYSETIFFLLSNQTILNDLLVNKVCSDALYEDLKKLTTKPLVLRTDGINIPSSKKQMLPRSDELRTPDAAREWLINIFRTKIIETGIESCDLCLIGHHFIPAAASAWCLAYPDKRRVRIESLWGIPEGLYWYPHDVYDVDTRLHTPSFTEDNYKEFIIKERLRFKGKFIAPNEDGKWVLHRTSKKYDWRSSITHKNWINEIAATSREIAFKANEPVVVMWFIDVNKKASRDAILPWYHERWDSNNNNPKASPRKNNDKSASLKIRTRQEWNDIKLKKEPLRNIRKLLIDPSEPELVRDQKFASELASFAEQNNITVVLSGGILSHAYYMLTKNSCEVECIDLYATREEEAEYNKLVRDKIPELISSHGEDVKLIKLKGEALLTSIKRKIVEEALEVYDAKNTDDIIEELADLQEIISALQKELKITKKTVESKRKDKAKKRGGFLDGIMLGQTALKSAFISDESFSNSINNYISSDRFEKTINQPELLPKHPNDFNVDTRYDIDGNKEKQLSFSLPIYETNASLPNSSFYINDKNNKEEKYIVNLTMERIEGVAKFKLRIKNAPEQLSLDI